MLGTNICQMITPILVLLIVLILKEVSKSNIDFMAEFSLYLPMPYLFHAPYNTLSMFGKVLNLNECEQWYLYDFGVNTTQASKDYWGTNTGFPMQNAESNGILSNENIVTYPC